MGFIKKILCRHKNRKTLSVCKAHYKNGDLAIHRKKVKCNRCGKVFIENVKEGRNEKVETGLKK